MKSWDVGVGDVAWRGWADRLPEELLPQKVFVVSTYTYVLFKDPLVKQCADECVFHAIVLTMFISIKQEALGKPVTSFSLLILFRFLFLAKLTRPCQNCRVIEIMLFRRQVYEGLCAGTPVMDCVCLSGNVVEQ